MFLLSNGMWFPPVAVIITLDPTLVAAASTLAKWLKSDVTSEIVLWVAPVVKPAKSLIVSSPYADPA